MTIPYALRLLCLCSACFFLAHTALALAAQTFAPAAIRFAERRNPRVACAALLFVRLLPALLTALVVLGLCVPSYLRLEAAGSAERVGTIFLALSLLGAFVLATSLARAARGVASSIRFTWRCPREGEPAELSTDSSPVYIIEGNAPLLALTGVFQSRIVVSRGVLEALSAEQLDAALRHERAHRTAHDNLKRLLLLLTPDALPFWRGFAALEGAWSRFAEWAADDSAREGDATRSLSLASALVSVARMGSAPRLSPLFTSLVPSDQDLSARVDRLLEGPSAPVKFSNRWCALLASGALLAASAFVTVSLHPTALHSIHELLEKLVH